MTISLVGSASAGVDSGSPSVTLPAGISNGDVVLAVGVCSTAQTLATPSGWTVVSGWPKDSGNARAYLWTKNAVVAGDSGTSVTFTSSAGNKVCVAVAVYHSTNGFPANPLDVTPAWQAHSSGTSYVAPQVTSATAGCWGVAAFVVRGTDPTAWAPAAGLTERQDLQRVGSGATSLHLTDSNGSVGGAGTAWGSFAETNISTTTGGGLSLLLKENTTGGGGGPTGPAYPVIGLWRNAPAEAGTWRQVMDGREAVYGTFQGHWSQYHGPGSLPLNAAEIQAIQDGKRLHIFWKPYPAGQHWAYTAAGSYDATINQVAQSIKSVSPAEVWLTLHHEPENDTTLGSGNFSYSAYRGMWQRVRARFDANQVTNVVWVCVFMNSHANPSSRFPAAGDGMINLWGSDGVMDGLVDIISQQDYIVCSTAASEIAVKWIEDLDFLDNNAAAGRQWHTKPKAVTEWGADLGGNLNPCGVSGGERGTAQHRADTIAAVEAILAELADRGVVELRYFDARSDWIQDPPSVDGAAFQSLKDASEAGQTGSGGGGGGGGSPGPILAAGFSLANDGDTQLTQQISFTLPDGWQPGDYALVWLSTNANPTITAEPVGWSLDDGPVTSANNTQKAWRYSRRLAAGDVDPTWTISQSVRPVGILGTYRGVDPTTPVHAAAPLTSNGTTASTSQPAAAVTTTTAEAVLVTAWLARWAAAGGTAVDTYADTYGSSSPAGTVYGTVPASHTADASASAASGANPGAGALVAHLTANPVAAGTYGPYTSSWPVAVTGITGQLALLPAATTPPPPPPPPPPVVPGQAGELPRVIVLAALGSPTTTDPQAGALVLNSGPPLEVGTIGGIAWVDISRDVQRVTIRRGRPGELEAAQPGGLDVVLDGRSGDYDPANANGPWYGQLDDGFPVWVRAEWGSVHDLGYAYCDEINLDLGYDPTVTFACVDALEVLGRARAGETGSSFDNDSSGARIARILDAVGWPSTLRALDTGRSQLLPTSFGDYALALIQKVLDTEFGTLFADGAGRVAFYDRYHQITSPRSTVVQANLTDTAGAGELEMESLTVDYSRGLVFTQAAVTREEEGAVTQVADNDESQARHGIRTFPGSPGPLLRSDSEALTLAQWLVDRYNTRKLRITQVVVDATTQDLWDVVLPLTILDRISVTRDYGPNTISGQLHIQGMTVEIVPDESWRWTLQTSSPNLTAPMVLNVGPGLGFGELGF